MYGLKLGLHKIILNIYMSISCNKVLGWVALFGLGNSKTFILSGYFLFHIPSFEHMISCAK